MLKKKNTYKQGSSVCEQPNPQQHIEGPTHRLRVLIQPVNSATPGHRSEKAQVISRNIMLVGTPLGEEAGADDTNAPERRAARLRIAAGRLLAG